MLDKFFVDAVCSGKENTIAPIEQSIDSNSTEEIENKKVNIEKKVKVTPRTSTQTKKTAVKGVTLQSEITEMDVCVFLVFNTFLLNPVYVFAETNFIWIFIHC